MGTMWLPGSVYSAGFRMNHHKLIDPYYPSRAYMGVGWGLRHPSRIFILMGVPKSHESLFVMRVYSANGVLVHFLASMLLSRFCS